MFSRPNFIPSRSRLNRNSIGSSISTIGLDRCFRRGHGSLDRARLPYISVLTDPTTGGVTASFAMLGDLNIAEPKALIGFAGPRVIEQTIRQKLPDGFQRSEFLVEHGMLDLVIDRRELKEAVTNVLRFGGAGLPRPAQPVPPALPSPEAPA